MKHLIAKTYRWFYYELLQRTEPFTWQFCRMEENMPYAFWFLFLLVGGIGWHWIFTGDLLHKFIGGFGLLFASWFIPHIIDSIQEHGWTPNPHTIRIVK